MSAEECEKALEEESVDLAIYTDPVHVGANRIYAFGGGSVSIRNPNRQ